jgi:hypothetical protein
MSKNEIPHHLMGLRQRLERADFLLSLVDGVCDDDGPFARVHLLAILDAGLEALSEAIDELDRLMAAPAASAD